MVRAAGSYPAGRWFESDRRYQKTIPQFNIVSVTLTARPLGQAVKTSPFHGGNTSSNLVGVTNQNLKRTQISVSFRFFLLQMF